MRRVLITCDTLGNGGAERQMTLLARNLPPDWQVRVFSLDDGPWADVLRSAGVDVAVGHRRARYDVTAGYRLWREMAAWRPDVVHSWGWMASAASLASCRLLGTPLVDGMVRGGTPPTRWAGVIRFLLARADAVIANSAAGVSAYQLTRPGTWVVHNGFEFERVPARTRPFMAEGAVPEIVMTGRMGPEKDFDALIDAARALRESGCNARFTLAGSGPAGVRLAERSRELVDAGYLRIIDCGLDVMGLLMSADVGVLLTDPRYAEGVSNSIMEYMACGLPVVCSDSGGNREIVVDGVTGLRVTPGDSAAVADALRRLSDGPELARRFGEAGRERIEKEFSIEEMVRSTIEVYESVICDSASASEPPGEAPQES